MASRSYGPQERHALETVATQVYSEAVAHGSLTADDPDLGVDRQRLAARDLLVDLGLLRLDETRGLLFPVDPATVQSQVVVPLSQEGAGLITESARWAETFSELGQVFRTSPKAASNPITEIHGITNINNFIDGVVGDCRKEILTAQPYGRRKAATLAIAEERDVKALERGVRMRTLYQHSARHSPATREYVAEIVSRGDAEVRTLDEFFKRLILVDRQVAVIPASGDHRVAIAVYDTSLIAYLVDIFERYWERAQPFNLTGVRAERNIADDVRSMTIRLLVEGHSDQASSKRLGVSTRTYGGYVAALKDEFGVDTRFQLGYAMGQDGTAGVRFRAQAPDEEPPEEF
ncbi:MAG TPA: LuxR family transcriptional regulator [Nocardioidaceae bacterium]|nr:LuxR family transcriptional regulator [Nocardioidaceae bacterium]